MLSKVAGSTATPVNNTRADRQPVDAVIFNASEFAMRAANPHKSVAVIAGRLKKYGDSLDGRLEKKKPMLDAKLLHQSLHRTRVLDTSHEPFQAQPVWKADNIEIARRGYECDCSVARKSGWICEHIVAAMVLVGNLVIAELLSVLPVRRRPGGQFKSRGPLARSRFNNSDARFFGINHLEQMHMESPACQHNWEMTKQFEFRCRGRALTREHVPGNVMRWVENGGRYHWRVKYQHGVVELLELEELAVLISYSNSVGARVIP